MDPKNKITATSLALTVTLMFLALKTLIPLLNSVSPLQNIAAICVFILASDGLYQLLTEGFSSLLLAVPWLKRWVFGAHYLEGTWVGYYQDPDYFCYLVETFEQNFDGITIRGSSFNQDCNRVAQWTSDSVSFDPGKGVLQYSYTCHIIPGKTVEQGIAYFALVRNRLTKPAKHLYGYSTDVMDGTRSPSWELKMSNHGIRPEDALAEAVKVKQQLEAKRKI